MQVSLLGSITAPSVPDRRQTRPFKDRGCKFAAATTGHPVKCLECPLPDCIYDSKHRVETVTAVRTMQVKRLRDTGLSIRAIARELQVSPRTVWRAIHGK